MGKPAFRVPYTKIRTEAMLVGSKEGKAIDSSEEPHNGRQHLHPSLVYKSQSILANKMRGCIFMATPSVPCITHMQCELGKGMSTQTKIGLDADWMWRFGDSGQLSTLCDAVHAMHVGRAVH